VPRGANGLIFGNQVSTIRIKWYQILIVILYNLMLISKF